ncbi:MAG: flagellar basal body P-ring formation chaperone FlgA [Helicobacteraceae bacterium]|jgi:flagella basal body P-ring formation protein FlgA|nr:flagellar basal body P-ring formation chaperone FlgA [Helicobacteraceae bacterium]
MKTFWFFAICFNFALAAPIYLSDRYALNEDEINASSLIEMGDLPDFTIDRFNGKSVVKIPKYRIKKIFAEKGIDVDLRSHTISFFYAKNIDLDAIAKMFVQKFGEFYPNVEIESVEIKLNSFAEIGDYSIVDIEVVKNNSKRKKGNFAIYFGDFDQFGNKSRLKKMYFDYEIFGRLKVIKAKKNISQGSTIGDQNAKESYIEFEQIKPNLLGVKALGKSTARVKIKEDEIITTNMIAYIPDVKKNSQLTIEVIKNGVRLTFIATAEKNGDIGDTILVKDQNKKIFNALIISKDLARLE